MQLVQLSIGATKVRTPLHDPRMCVPYDNNNTLRQELWSAISGEVNIMLYSKFSRD